MNMGLNPIALFLLVSYMQIQLVHNQYSSGYGSCDPYVCYGYGQPDYTQASYPSVYSQPCSNPHRSEQPTVVVLSDRYNDNSEWNDFLNFISSLPSGPIFIPYPVPVSSCDDGYSDNSCLDCGSRNSGCGCSNSEIYDTWDNGCNCNCGCRNQEQSRSNCNLGKCSDTDCSFKKSVIIHKSECCCRS